MYDPVYSQNIGLCGYRCRVKNCRKVVPTYSGIIMHCKRVHGLTAQMKIFEAPTLEEKNGKEAKAGEQSQPIRDERIADNNFGTIGELFGALRARDAEK